MGCFFALLLFFVSRTAIVTVTSNAVYVYREVLCGSQDCQTSIITGRTDFGCIRLQPMAIFDEQKYLPLGAHPKSALLQLISEVSSMMAF